MVGQALADGSIKEGRPMPQTSVEVADDLYSLPAPGPGVDLSVSRMVHKTAIPGKFITE
jgi:hypothetical protein